MTTTQRPVGYDPGGEARLERANAELDACNALVKAADAARRSLTKSERERIDAAIEDKHHAVETVRLAKELNEVRGPVFAYGEGGGGPSGTFSKAIIDESLIPESPYEKIPGNVLGVTTLSKALGLKAPTISDSAEFWNIGEGAISAIGFDKRYMFTTLPRVQAEAGQTSVDDFRVTARAVTGTVQRDLDAVTAKATLDHTFDRVLVEMRQFAIVIPSVPNALLEVRRSNGSVRSILDGEGRQQVENAIDAAASTAISAGAASAGDAALDIVANIRTGIGDLRAFGYEPDTLVVDSATAISLDLFEKSTGAGYQFAVRNSNDSDPLFGLRVIEAKAATAVPLLYDSRRVGVQYLGTIAAMVDPFSGATGDNFNTNRTDLRLEATALTVVRDAAAAITLDGS